MRQVLSSAVASALLGFAAAQQPAPIPARAFFPDDHDTMLVADVAAMRSRGIFDELETSVAKVVVKMIEKELGFPIAALDRATLVVAPSRDEQTDLLRRLVVLEGNRELPLPDRVARGEYEREGAAGRVLYRNLHQPSAVFVRPQPDMQVMGSDAIIAPVLEGKRGPGVPSADLMSLASTRGGSLVLAIVSFADARTRADMLGSLLPDAKWTAGDAPTHGLLRVHCVGDEHDPHICIEAVLRHAQAGPGVTATEGFVDAAIDRLRANPQLLMLKPLWSKVQKHSDRGDLCLSLDLGRAREAIGHFATWIAAQWFVRVEAVQVEAAAAPVAVPVPVPVPEAPK